MSFIGSLNVFDHKNQEWQIFCGKLNQFMKLNKIEGGDQASLLLTHLSDETYRLARNLVHPKELDAVSFEELVSKLNGHFKPKRSTFVDRAKFYDAVISEGESIEDWAARLRGLAVYCEFGVELLDTLLRDKFILGLKEGRERDRLFEKDSASLTFAKAVEVAQQAACARGARTHVMVDGGPGAAALKEEPVYRVVQARERRDSSVATTSTARGAVNSVRCSVCGYKNHESVKCRFKNYSCQKCGEKGHLKKMCKASSENSKLHHLVSDEQSHKCEECDLFNMRYVNNDPIIISIEINKLKFDMELDSGSGTSVISEKLYLQHFKNYNLIKTDLRMCLYNGHKIIPIGYFICTVSYFNTCQNIRFYVIQNGGPPLLGRDFMTKFKIYFSSTYVNKINVDNQCTREVQQLLYEFPDLWKDELGCFNKFEIDFQLKEGARPVFFKPRSIPFALKNKVEDELARLVDLGILVPVNFSEYATPIVPVLKANGQVKIAGDFSCTLNKILKIDKYPLPRIEEVFAKIGGGLQYSKLDLSNAYNQFKLCSSSQDLTTINTPKGLFKYTRLVYGLANAPAIFQRAMETLLAGIEGVTCWLDDVCCTAPTRELHLLRIREILKRMQDAGLRLQKDKCAFFQDSVTYLGYVIDKNGLRTCPKKVDAILKAPRPTNVLETKRFLGVVNYYRNFVPNASSLLNPLHTLLRAGITWHWGESQQHAFDKVKEELASDRLLAHFDPAVPLVLTVDAGPSGLGAVLSHVDNKGCERPIAFASRSLSVSEKVYSQIQKEATAIIFGVKHFHQYLYGRQEPFILKTDHRPLLSIFGKKNGVSVTAALRLQRYAIILSAYNYVVQYITAKNNLVADYFSRAPLPPSQHICKGEEENKDIPFLFLDATTKPVSSDDIKKATALDKVLATVIKYMNHGWPRKITCQSVLPYFYCKTDLEMNDGCLFRGHRIIIPRIYRVRMLEELHSAHFGIVKTKSAARSRMWWPGIDKDIERWIGECNECSQVRNAPPRASPAPWPRPSQPWYRIHIDYMSVGQNVYLVVIDAFSKWLECIHMNNGTSTNALIMKLKGIFSTFGIPNVIVSDNDAKIRSTEFHQFCNNNGIKHLTSPVYHPASNGQAENSVKTCKKMLKCIIDNRGISQRGIHEKLLSFLFEYRNTAHCSTGITPAMLMFGRKLRSRLDVILPCKTEKISDDSDKVKLNPSRNFQVGEVIWCKCFSGRKAQWELGKIIRKLGIRVFDVYIEKYNIVCKRHLDQICKQKGNVITKSVDNYCDEYFPTEITECSESQQQQTVSSLSTNESSTAPPCPPSPSQSPIELQAGANIPTEGNIEVLDGRVEEGLDVVAGVGLQDKPTEPGSGTSGVGRSVRERKEVCYKKFF